MYLQNKFLVFLHFIFIASNDDLNPSTVISKQPPTGLIAKARHITAVGKNYLKTQQCQLSGRISYKTIAK